MKLIVGLGNPGSKYKKTWHNLGFMVVDRLQEDLGLSVFKENSKLKASISDGRYNDEKIILVKPDTFMNNSGQAVSLIKNYYKAEDKDIVIIHDDVDIELGRVKIASNSSAGGHNGIKSVIEHLGTKNFTRIKIGIKTAKLEKVDTAKYVLEKIHLFHGIKIKDAVKTASRAIQTLMSKSLTEAMNIHN